MPFWQPKTLDSKNILDKKFWSIQNLFGQSATEKLRQEKLQELNTSIPKQLCDPYTGELIEEPAFTPYGNIFNRSTLVHHWTLLKNCHIQTTTCPLTNKPLNEDNLLKPQDVPYLARWFSEIKQRYQELSQKIKTMRLEDKDLIEAELIHFKNYLSEMAILVEIDQKSLRNVSSIKENLKLDVQSTDNLIYWNNVTLNQLSYYLPYLNNYLLSLTGHELVKDKDQHSYVISKDIMQLMHVTHIPYSSENELVNALNNSINESKNGWRFRMFCCLRNKHEKVLMEADDLKTLRLT